MTIFLAPTPMNATNPFPSHHHPSPVVLHAPIPIPVPLPVLPFSLVTQTMGIMIRHVANVVAVAVTWPVSVDPLPYSWLSSCRYSCCPSLDYLMLCLDCWDWTWTCWDCWCCHWVCWRHCWVVLGLHLERSSRTWLTCWMTYLEILVSSSSFEKRERMLGVPCKLHSFNTFISNESSCSKYTCCLTLRSV